MKSIKEVINKENLFDDGCGNDLNYGYECVNSLFSVLPQNNIITIASLAAMGKTNFALNLSLKLVDNNDCSVLYITRNEIDETIYKRLLTIDSNVPFRKFNNPKISQGIKTDIIKSALRLDKKSIFIHEVFKENNQIEKIDEVLMNFTFSTNKSKKVVIVDDYCIDMVSKIRNKLEKYDLSMIILYKIKHTNFLYDYIDLPLYKVDKYVRDISDSIALLHRPSYFESTSNNFAYLKVVKNKMNTLGIVRFEYNHNTFRFYEEGEVSEIPRIKKMIDKHAILDDELPF